jgi:DNA-binding transcriptional ArsR family regulator
MSVVTQASRSLNFENGIRHGIVGAVNTLDLLLHPVRIRIVHAMSGGDIRTTSELAARLPDVPRATIYRHIGLLADGGVLEVVDEQRVHGAVERHYRLHQDRTVIDRDDAATMSLDDHRRGFAGATAALLAEFNAYLDRDGADPVADQVGYRQGVVWVSPDEMTAMVEELRAVFLARATNARTPDRRPYLMSAIFFPTEEAS